MRRRTFVATSGTALTLGLAGCSSLGIGGGGGGDDGGADVSNPDSGGGSGGGSSTTTFADTTYEIPEDGYQGLEFSLSGTRSLSWDAIVRSGPEVDIFVMPQTEFENYENQERFRFSSTLSRQAITSASAEARLDGGDYAFVVDNTNLGEAQPPTNLDDDVAEVEVEFVAE